MSRRRLLGWVVGGALAAVVLGGTCAGEPACEPGSLKGERGELYYCQDDGSWVKDDSGWVR